MRHFFILLLIVFSLGACGQKGDLYLETDKAPAKPTARTTKSQENIPATSTQQTDKTSGS